jgi:hypothetical protein
MNKPNHAYGAILLLLSFSFAFISCNNGVGVDSTVLPNGIVIKRKATFLDTSGAYRRQECAWNGQSPFA